jgi:hypothetical protein
VERAKEECEICSDYVRFFDAGRYRRGNKGFVPVRISHMERRRRKSRKDVRGKINLAGARLPA